MCLEPAAPTAGPQASAPAHTAPGSPQRAARAASAQLGGTCSTHQVKFDLLGPPLHLLGPRRQPLLQLAQLAPRRLQLLARGVPVRLGIRQRSAQFLQGLWGAQRVRAQWRAAQPGQQRPRGPHRRAAGTAALQIQAEELAASAEMRASGEVADKTPVPLPKLPAGSQHGPGRPSNRRE